MKVFGGTCPMCCGDLDAEDSRPDGAAVCLFCHFQATGREIAPRNRHTSDAILPALGHVTHPGRPSHHLPTLGV